MERILNIGCGNDTYGTDFVDLYPQRNEVKECTIDSEKLPYKKGTFDKIISNFVFEHLKNHDFALKEMKRVLKKGGTIELKTDNASYWYWSLNNKAHTGGYGGKYGKKDRHFGLFTDLHLFNYFSDIGFKNMKIKYIGHSGSFLKSSFRGKIIHLINFLFKSVGPLKRMGYASIKITAEK